MSIDILSFPIMSFGKHKGKAFNTLPQSYLGWMARAISDPYLRACASAYLRGVDAPNPEDCVYITSGGDPGEIEINATFVLKDDITELSERHWDGENKKWMIPLHGFDELMQVFPKAHVSASLRELIGDKLKKQSEIKGFVGRTTPVANITFDNPGLHLFPYQNVAVEFAEANNGRCMLAMEQGTGKTMATIGYMRTHPGDDTIIVCPSIMKPVWKTEIYKWLGIDATVLSGRKPDIAMLESKPVSGEVLQEGSEWRWDGIKKNGIPPKPPSGKPGSVWILNYEIMGAWLDTLKTVSGNPLIVFDESHYLKNSKSKRTKAAKTLAGKVSKTILLTGTPIMNHPSDLFSQLNIIDPASYPNFFGFAKRYCGAYQWGEEGHKLWNFDGATNIEELAERLQSTIMLRQTKEQCLPDLPDKMHTRVPLQVSGGDPGDIMDVMRAKIPHVIEHIRDLLTRVDKLVVFCTHTEILESVCSEFDAMRIDGKVHDDHEVFQHDPDKHIIVCNVDAAGVGITLTAASHAVFCEIPYTPSKLEQAADRLHRIGTKNAVNYYYMIAENTIDEAIADMVINKKKVVNRVMLDKMAADFRELSA